MKKLLAVLFIATMLLGSVTVSAAVDIVVKANTYTETSKPQSTTNWGSISFENCVLTYTVTAPESGVYLIKPTFGTYRGDPTVISLEVNGASLGTYNVSPTDSAPNFSAMKEYELAYATLQAGNNTFKIGCTHNIFMQQVTFSKVDSGMAGKRETLTIGSEAFAEGSVYPRGTDKIVAGYDTAIMAGTTGDVKLACDEGEVAVSAVPANKNVNIYIKETLQYNTVYTLTLENIQDIYGNVLDTESFVFTTSDASADRGNGSASIDTFTIISDDVTVTGVAKGSDGMGVAGRTVKLSVTLPGQAPMEMASGVSGAEGAYTLTCNLSEYDISGDVTAAVEAEYAVSPATETYCDYVSAANRIVINGGQYSSTSNAESTSPKGNGGMYYGTGVTVTYNFKAVREGGFLLSGVMGTYGGRPITLTIHLDGAHVADYVLSPTVSDGSVGGMGPLLPYDICGMWLTAGEHELTIHNEGTTHYISSLTFLKQPSAEIDSVRIGGNAYRENDTYSRGTDVISVLYTNDIADNSFDGITLTEQGGQTSVPVSVSLNPSNAKEIRIALRETPDYNKSYTLSLAKVKDACGYTLQTKTFDFATKSMDDENPGSGSTVINSFSITDGIAAIQGVVNSSQGVGIKGRKVDWYLTLPNETKTLVESAVSGTDGIFDIRYTLPADDVKGNVRSTVCAEYADEAVKDYYYISGQYILPILKSLESTQTWEEAKEILETNQGVLGISPDTDLAGLAQEGFYSHFVGASISSTDQFRKFYSAMLVAEKINQATNESAVKAALTEEALALFEIDANKMTVLENSLSRLCRELLNADTIHSEEEFVKAFDNAFNKALAEKANLSDISLAEDSASVREGAEAELSLIAADPFTNIKEFNLRAELGGVLAGNADYLDFTSSLGSVTKRVEGNTVYITVAVEDISSQNDTIGALSLVNSKAGTGTVTFTGTATGNTGTAYDALLEVSEKAMHVSVTEQKKNSDSSASRGSGGGGGSKPKGSVIAPTDDANTDITTVQQEVFSDLSEAEWAKEYIMGLYNMQAITKPEEGKFYPNREITRAEFIKIVVLANDMYTGSTTVVNFNDVSEGDWYYQYVKAAVNFSVIEGDDTGSFRPNDRITREDICVILSRLQSKAEDTQLDDLFADDASISAYAKAAVYGMKKAGIVTGLGNNVFEPKANATRAMAAKIIYGIAKQ